MEDHERKQLKYELRKALAPFIPDDGLTDGTRGAIIDDVAAFSEMLIKTMCGDGDPLTKRGLIDSTGTKLRMTLDEPVKP